MIAGTGPKLEISILTILLLKKTTVLPLPQIWGTKILTIDCRYLI